MTGPALAGGIFAVPVRDRYVLYAPHHGHIALVNAAALRCLREAPAAGGAIMPQDLETLCDTLTSAGQPSPAGKQGPFAPPFLGLIPTRACNLACAYCDFWLAQEAGPPMALDLAQAAVDWYLDLRWRQGGRTAEIHFFGGEPFSAAPVVDFSVCCARDRARALDLQLRFEVATNGTFGEQRCQWIADRFQTVVLSLDGPRDIHDRHRSDRGGRGSFDQAMHNARTLGEGPADLCLRACITRDTVNRLPEIARFFCRELRPQAVCFETLQRSARSERAGLQPPDPWLFAANYVEAVRILADHGVEAVNAGTDIHRRRVSFCPVATDAAIVSPDGEIAACYLLRRDRAAAGMALRLGAVSTTGAVRLDEAGIDSARQTNVLHRAACSGCFCRWHCAGGCHVNHRSPGAPGNYDDVCIQTRIISLCKLLAALGQPELAADLLGDRAALEAAVLQPSDDLMLAAAFLRDGPARFDGHPAGRRDRDRGERDTVPAGDPTAPTAGGGPPACPHRQSDDLRFAPPERNPGLDAPARATAVTPAPWIRWVREADQVLLLHQSGNHAWSLRGAEEVIWDLLVLGHPLPTIADFLLRLRPSTPQAAHEALQAVLATWGQEGLVVAPGDGGHA